MNNFNKNVMGGLLVAFYLMCFAFPFQLFLNMFRDHLPIEQFLINQLITFFVVWVIGYFCTELYRDLLANANKPRSEDEKDTKSEDKAGKKSSNGPDSESNPGPDQTEK